MPTFEWDAYNEREVLAHGVQPDEAEELFEDERLLARPAHLKDGEQRQAIIASTRAAEFWALSTPGAARQFVSSPRTPSPQAASADCIWRITES
jgi:hypothetical protein